jgi:hypothetical protein
MRYTLMSQRDKLKDSWEDLLSQKGIIGEDEGNYIHLSPASILKN